MAKGKYVNIAHTEFFVLNQDFEDILNTLEDNKEVEYDFEEVSESISITKVIYNTCFLFGHLFESENKKFVKRSDLPLRLQARLSYRNCDGTKN